MSGSEPIRVDLVGAVSDIAVGLGMRSRIPFIERHGDVLDRVDP